MFSLFFASALLALPAASSTPSKPETPNISLTQPADGGRDQVCYKMRTYIFERNDEAAPRLVRETTCPPVRPRLNKAKVKARFVPAD